MAKADPHGDRASRLVKALQQQKEEGGEYPLTAGRLRELADAEATDEELFKALSHKSISDKVILAAKKDLTSPVALADDAKDLAGSSELLEYALGKLASAEK